jgi:hypothetical protein
VFVGYFTYDSYKHGSAVNHIYLSGWDRKILFIAQSDVSNTVRIGLHSATITCPIDEHIRYTQAILLLTIVGFPRGCMAT